MSDDPSPSMRSIVAAMKIGAAVPIAIQRALPNEAARKGVGLRMVGKAFLRGPALPTGRAPPARQTCLGSHAASVTWPERDCLLWAMAFAHSWKCASENPGPLTKKRRSRRRLSTGFGAESAEEKDPSAKRRGYSARLGMTAYAVTSAARPCAGTA
jgi:hypothetical protein